MDIVWKEWYRHIDGEVFYEKGFSFVHDPDYFYFRTTPEIIYSKTIDENHTHYCHINELFDSKKEVNKVAMDWCKSQCDLILSKMMKLMPCD